MRAIPQRQPLFLGGSIGGVPSFDLNFARGDNAVTKYGFVFTRATSATYVNSTGLIATAASGELRYTYDPVTLSALGVLIEEARTNLTATSTGGSIGGGVTVATGQSGAPDGSSTVVTTTGDGAASTHYTWNGAGTATISAAAQYCMSLHVRPGTAARVQLMSASATWGTSYANFSLVGAGSVLANGATSAGIQQLANGWYRIWIVATSAGAGSINVGSCLINADAAARLPSFSGSDSAMSYSTWGAQVEAGAFPTSYIHTSGTAATRNADVLSLTGAAGRTNLVPYSQDLDNAAWDGAYFTPYGSGSIANATTAPDGSATAEFVLPQTTAGVAHYVRHAVATVAASTVYCFSVYVKAGGYSKTGIRESAATGAWATFDLSGAGSVIASSGLTAGISGVGGGWYRITGYASSGGGTTHRYATYILDNAYTSGSPNTYTFTADGTSGIYIWGAQLETGSSATTYVATTNGPRTVENVASWFSNDEGTVVCDFNGGPGFGTTSAYMYPWHLGIGSAAAPTIATRKQDAVGNSLNITMRAVGAGVLETTVASGAAANTNYKIALAYKLSVPEIVESIGGAAVVSHASPSALLYGITTLRVGANTSSTGYLNGTISRIRYYPRRLPDATLRSLTA